MLGVLRAGAPLPVQRHHHEHQALAVEGDPADEEGHHHHHCVILLSTISRYSQNNEKQINQLFYEIQLSHTVLPQKSTKEWTNKWYISQQLISSYLNIICFNTMIYIYSLSTIYLPSILITVFFPWLIVLRKIEILLSTLDKLLTQY